MLIDAYGLKAKTGVFIGSKEVWFDEADIRALSTEVAGGFVGCTVGMYAFTDKDAIADPKAIFKEFKYEV